MNAEETLNLAKGLQLKLTDGGQTLTATFDPTMGKIDEALLRKTVAERGYDGIELVQWAVDDLLQRQEESGKAYTMVIGGSRDAEASVSIENDKMTAHLFLVPAFGKGLGLTREQVMKALNRAGIVAGILEEAVDLTISRSVAKETPEPILIARGKPATDGVDGEIESLIPNAADRRPRIREDGTVDYRDRGEVVVVNPGTAFVRRKAPSQGESGFTVMGESLAARDGQPVKLKPLDKSAEVSQDDPDVLIATITGQPVILPDGAKVEPILRVDDVSVASGHVIYDGTVIVKGDVQSGMKIEATGDIRVGGVVEGASISAGGDVVVNGGVIGRGGVRDKGGNLRPEAAVIRANGLVSARFVENAFVEADGDVLVRDLIRHSEVNSVTQIVVGGGSNSRGQILGGLTKAGQLVQAGTLGAPASVHTTVEVGDRSDLHKRIREVENELQTQEGRLLKVEAALGQLKQNPKAPEDMVARLKAARRQLTMQIEKLQSDRQRMKEESEEAARGQVVAGKKVFNNVHVVIDGKSRTVEEERNSVTFVLDGVTVECR